MSQSTETTRPDPLLDAYRQASVREGARAGANVRAAVLAHARVVAQSSRAAVVATGLTEATRATPAANESKPIWRLAAGVVIGLVGVWIFQLTRPSAAPDTAVAVVTPPSAPQADKARTPEPASPPAAAAPEATVAVTAPPAAKERASKPVTAAREREPEAALPEQNLAMAKVLAPKEKTDRASVFTGAAAPATAASAADTSASAMSNEVVIAAAEMRKSAKLASRAEPSVAAPNAFPAQAPEVAIAAASPARPAPTAPATVAAPSRAGASGSVGARGEAAPIDPAATAARPQTSIQMSDAARVAPLGESDVAMFRALRAGDIPALRFAISRGANVNGKDERGRTPLQIAREGADIETIKVLEAAGAR